MARKKQAAPKPRTVTLTDDQRQVLTARYIAWQEAVARYQRARFWRRRARRAVAEAYGVLDAILVVAFGKGAVLSVVNNQVQVTLP